MKRIEGKGQSMNRQAVRQGLKYERQEGLKLEDEGCGRMVKVKA